MKLNIVLFFCMVSMILFSYESETKRDRERKEDIEHFQKNYRGL